MISSTRFYEFNQPNQFTHFPLEGSMPGGVATVRVSEQDILSFMKIMRFPDWAKKGLSDHDLIDLFVTRHGAKLVAMNATSSGFYLS